MRVLHVLYALQPSGMEKMLHASAALWQAKGVITHILANDDMEGPFADALRGRGYVVHRIPWCRSLRHLLIFWRLLRRESYDAVHLHTYRGYLGFAVMARLAGVKHMVYTTHAIFASSDRLRHTLHILRRHLAKALGVRFVSVGKSVQDNEKKVYRLDTELIWNWTDTARFSKISDTDRQQARDLMNIAPELFALVSIGNCSGKSAQRTKNHRLILEGIAKLPADIRERTIYLHIGKEDAAEGEQHLATDLGIEKRIRFLGSQEDVRTFLAAADLYVMSSLHEGLGNATIEAALCGVPLLLTDVPGLRDFKAVLQDNIFMTGLDVAEMTAALERVARMPHEVLTAMGDRCSQLAEKSFSMEKSVSRYLALYKGEA